MPLLNQWGTAQGYWVMLDAMRKKGSVASTLKTWKWCLDPSDEETCYCARMHGPFLTSLTELCMKCQYIHALLIVSGWLFCITCKSREILPETVHMWNMWCWIFKRAVCTFRYLKKNSWTFKEHQQSSIQQGGRWMLALLKIWSYTVFFDLWCELPTVLCT